MVAVVAASFLAFVSPPAVAPAGAAKAAVPPASRAFTYLGGRPTTDPGKGGYFRNANPDQTSWQVVFSTTGRRVSLWIGDFGGDWQITVNGRAAGRIHHSAASSPAYRATLAFPSRQKRTITLRMARRIYFGGATAYGGAITRATVKRGRRIVFLGDSVTQGVGADAGFTSYAIRAADMTGLRDAWNAGSGGTGYTTGGTTPGRQPFGARAQRDVVAARPDIVVIAGGLNDAAAPPETTRAAAAALYADLRAKLPNAKLIVVGPFPTATIRPALAATRDAIKTAAAEAGIPFVDPIAEQWVTPENVGMLIGPDGVHPTQAGHDRFGALLARDLRPLLG